MRSLKWTAILTLILIHSAQASFIGSVFSHLTSGNNPAEQRTITKPPINQEYANQLRILKSLSLADRLNYVKSGLLRTGANALKFKGNLYQMGSQNLNNAANNLYNTRHTPNYPSNFPANPSSPSPIGFTPRNPSLIPGSVDDAELVIDPGLTSLTSLTGSNSQFGSLQQVIARQRLIGQQQQLLQQINRGPASVNLAVQQPLNAPSTCSERLGQLVGDIFIGNEMIPQVLDLPPDYPLELTYRTVRTYPGMRLTAEATRFKPMLNWPVEQGVLYTVIMSNLDINSRRNRTLAEFWHWFVANIPGNSVDDGQEIFQLLHPLVLPEGSGDHRFGYFVLKQPSFLNYEEEGGPTDNCSPVMSAGRGPFRSTKEFMKKYGLRLVAATFLILDSSQASVEIACEWQNCMGGEVFLKDLDCTTKTSPVSLQKRK